MAEINKQNTAAAPQAKADAQKQGAAEAKNKAVSSAAAALAAAQAARQQAEPNVAADTQTMQDDRAAVKQPTARVQHSTASSAQQRSGAALPRAAMPSTAAMQQDESQQQKRPLQHSKAAFFQSSTPANATPVQRFIPPTPLEETQQELSAKAAFAPQKQTARFQQPEEQQESAPKRARRESTEKSAKSVQQSNGNGAKKKRETIAAQDDQEDEEDVKPPINFMVLFLSITAIILVVSCITVFFMLDQFLFGKFDDVDMPNFDGLKVSDIQYNEDYKSFNIKYEDVYTEETPVGVVVGQTPRAPRKVKENTSVTLYVSAGVHTVEVPNITKMPREEAKQLLEEAGLNVIFKPVVDTTTVPDTVLNTIPAAGEQVAEGETIQAFFTRDETSILVKVPNCVGLSSMKEAITTLAKEGFAYEISEESLGDGTVSAQVPEAGSMVPRGSNVTITLDGVGAGATGLDALPEKQITGADGHVHEYVASSVVSPNEYSIGYTVYACSVCNYFYYDDYTSPSAG